MKWPHWLRCDWTPWSETYESGGRHSILGAIVMRLQDRTCRKCNKIQERDVTE